MLPDFVIIGAQKSASTFLHQCLREHPDVYMPEGETPFFETPDYETAGRDTRALERLFDGRSEKRLGIKRPSYLGKPEVPPRIEAHLPHAKLFAVLRNPVDRAVSAYFHNVNYGFIPALDIEEGMRRLLSDPSYTQRYRRSSEILEFSRYHEHLVDYGGFMRRGQLLVLLHDDVVADPLEAVRKTFAFLDVDDTLVPPSLHARPQAVVYDLRRLRVLRMRNRLLYDYDAGRTRLHPKQPGLGGKLMARALTVGDRVVLGRLLGNHKPRLSAGLKSLLYERFASDIEALEALIGRDLTAWKHGAGRI